MVEPKVVKSVDLMAGSRAGWKAAQRADLLAA
jgi:hypothetical protein